MDRQLACQTRFPNLLLTAAQADNQLGMKRFSRRRGSSVQAALRFPGSRCRMQLRTPTPTHRLSGLFIQGRTTDRHVVCRISLKVGTGCDEDRVSLRIRFK